MKWGQAASAAIVALALLVAGITVGSRVLGKSGSGPVSASVRQEALVVSSGGSAGLDVAAPASQVTSPPAAAPVQVPTPEPTATEPTATPEATATPAPATPTPEPTATPQPPAPAAAPAVVEQPALPAATPVPPMPTATPVPPTPTPVPPTATPLPPTPTATGTPRPPIATPTSTPRVVQALAVVATATPTIMVTATRTPLPFVAGSVSGKATPYADSLAGNSMGCKGAGPYNINDITVVAVSAAQHTMFPCGTRLEICGQLGCITGMRKDSCPGCGNGDVDLSRAGFHTVCGNVNNCVVRTRSIP